MKRPQDINVLIGCEESQAVCIAFRERGFNAFSCDIQDCSGGHPEWHLKMDVFEAIDLLKPSLAIYHPPCTHLSVSGAKHFKDKQARQIGALYFVRALLDTPVDHIALENPISVISSKIKKPDQIVQPWQFGHGETKSTCLWLKGLPKLMPTEIVDGREQKIWKLPPSADRAKLRSKTFEGIARAMAEQWGDYVLSSLK